MFGAGMQTNGPNRVADDFTVAVAGGWNVTGFSFFGYQTFSNSAFTFTGLSWSIVAGDVNTGSIVASGSVVPTNGGLVGYRTTASTLSNQDRAIFQIDADVPDFTLGVGSYWLQWSVAGSLAAGPFQPPPPTAPWVTPSRSSAARTSETFSTPVMPRAWNSCSSSAERRRAPSFRNRRPGR